MKLKEIIHTIRNSNLPNVTERILTNDENVISLINDSLVVLYNQFNIKFEQAIILVPKYRNIFTIDEKDPNVIMGTTEKISKARTLTDIYDNHNDKENILERLNLDKNTLRLLKGKSLLQPIEIDSNLDDLLQIVNVEDNEGNEYNFNVDKVFIIDYNTLYFPECKEGMQIYVKYKTKPKRYTIDNLNDEIDLPQTLFSCLYSYINLKVISGVEGLKEFYPNVLNTYNQCLQKALMEGQALPNDLRYSLHLKKGFY